MRLLILTLALANLAAAERLVLRDGTSRTGAVTAIDRQNITLESGGKSERIARSRVVLILLDDAPAETTRSINPEPRPVNADPPGDPLPAANRVSTAENFRIELIRCAKRARADIVCSLRIANLGTDRKLGLHGDYKSAYVDAKGMAREATHTTIGSSSDRYALSPVVSDVPVDATVTFPAVEPGVTSLAKLTISFWVENGPEFTIEQRRVPLE